MSSAVETRGSDYDLTQLNHVLQRAIVLGLFESIVVVIMSFVTRLTGGVVEAVVGGLVLLISLSIVTVVPGLWTRARTVEGIAGAAGIGLGATVVFLLVDVSILQNLHIYSNRWLAIGGRSDWWYHPVWWMAGTYLPWLGAFTLANRAGRGRSVGVAAVMVPAVACTVVLAIIGILIHFPGARWTLGTFGVSFVPGLALATLLSGLGPRRA